MTHAETEALAQQYDWLQDFVSYTSFGEASPRLMYWVGVVTLAGVLQRKVWFDMGNFIVSPNFFILTVGKQGKMKKSTSIDLGLSLLKTLKKENKEGIIDLGPHEATWQGLVKHLSSLNMHQTFCLEEQQCNMACTTLGLSEFGVFYKKEEEAMIQGLTDVWDNKDYFYKMTKGNGSEYVDYPWVNLIGGTTPEWILENFSDTKIRGGLVSRFIFLYGEKPIRPVAWPKRNRKPGHHAMRESLLTHMRKLLALSGEVELTEEAYAWGKDWYDALWARMQNEDFDLLEGGYLNRKQAHMLKTAIVIAASRDHLPTVELSDVQEAVSVLTLMEEDARSALGGVGSTRVTATAQRLAEEVKKRGGKVNVRELYRRMLDAHISWRDYMEAANCAIKAGHLRVEGGTLDSLIAVFLTR